MSDKSRIGIVGVGRMGLAMLKHLVKHGHPVTPAISTASNATPRVPPAQPSRRRRPSSARPRTLSSSASATTTRSTRWCSATTACWRAEAGRDHRGVVDRDARQRQGARREGARQGHRHPRRADLPWPLVRPTKARLLALVGGKPEVVERGRADLRHVLLRHRASGRGRPRPGRQGDEQPAALDQRHRPDRGRPARRIDRHRSAEAARRADDELRRIARRSRTGT